MSAFTEVVSYLQVSRRGGDRELEPALAPAVDWTTSVMGVPDHGRGIGIMGGSDRSSPLDLMGTPDGGRCLHVTGGPDRAPRLDVMGQSNPRFVDCLFTGR